MTEGQRPRHRCSPGVRRGDSLPEAEYLCTIDRAGHGQIACSRRCAEKGEGIVSKFENGWICQACWTANREQDLHCYRCKALSPDYRRNGDESTPTAPDPAVPILVPVPPVPEAVPRPAREDGAAAGSVVPSSIARVMQHLRDAIRRGGEAFEDQLDRTDIGGVAGATVGFRLGGLLSFYVNADDYIYNASFTGGTATEEVVQHDVHLSFGLGVPLGARGEGRR